MVGLGFSDHQQNNTTKKNKSKKHNKVILRSTAAAAEPPPASAGFRGRLHHGGSPADSVISCFTDESSNLSMFSSACVTVDRRSFASEIPDHEALVSELSKHLAGRDLQECSSSPDPDSSIFAVQKSNGAIRTEEMANVLEEKGDDEQTLDPARVSFSQAVRECQHGRLRPEAHPAKRKADRQRPVSLDLNNSITNANSSPPRFRGVRKSSASSGRLDTFMSPGTPNYCQGNVGLQKGWSSERVPLPSNGGRRIYTAGILPFNHGRALPSKWEDAEKWICSPVGGDSASRCSLPPPHRRPKSKSGPLGQPKIVYHSVFSPSMPTLEGGTIGNYTASSPFSTGVLAVEALPGRGRCNDVSSSSSGDGSSGSGSGSRERSYVVQRESCIVRSASIHGWSTDYKEEKEDNDHEAENGNSYAVSRRDVATQMSPEGSTHHSSAKGRSSYSPSHPTSLHPIVELQSHPTRVEVRDVQVDDQVIVTRWSQKHGPLVSQKGPTDKDWKASQKVSGWEVAEPAKCASKSKREEARITAWENLQKAKAETAMRKLEMKLEKKRSYSMDKIMNKLRSAQKKAQVMRNSVSSSRNDQVARFPNKIISFRKPGQIRSLSGCFTCHAF